MFNVGDRVKLEGIVKDSVTDTSSGRVSVLVETEGKEYWLQEVHLSSAAGEAPVAAPPEVVAEPAAEPQAEDEE